MGKQIDIHARIKYFQILFVLCNQCEKDETKTSDQLFSLRLPSMLNDDDRLNDDDFSFIFAFLH